MKIGVYGGTFDPPHMGHFLAAKQIKDRLELDKLILVPAKEPPHKPLSDQSATPEQRLNMTQLMADGVDPAGGVQVSDCELVREGKSYTVDTLAQISAKNPGAELWLVMGSDMFLSFHNWYEPEKICRLAGICGFTRTTEETAKPLKTQARRLEKDLGAKTQVIDLPEDVDVSSTDIRTLLAQGKHRQASQLLWSQVYGYILREGLYGSKIKPMNLTNYQLRAVSYSMLRAKRIPHMMGTEETAVKLAKRWGANLRNARRGAILHDCTKYFTYDHHMELCERYHIPLDDIERESEKLLHAKTGAALACHIFGEPVEVQSAIYYHTTGKGNMSLLEKILYLADYMEPHRDFPGVEKLRELAYTDLDGAVALGCQMSIAEMKEKNRHVHPNTQAALLSLKH